MEFETLFKFIVAAVAVFGIPIAGYAAVAATRAIWIKGEPGKVSPELEGHVAALEARVAELEAERDRLAELEERVDFAERLLVRENQQPGIGPVK
ncbi:MAG TPA: hypothetical protein VGP80_04040 [Gemmatimonadales bacterium]|jgi:Tfp pilus assembly protein PilO|nr:hypothetical protein [Gemmatimonadales bacterium]